MQPKISNKNGLIEDEKSDNNLVNVLLVDNNQKVLENSIQILEKKNKFTIEVAHDAQEAIKKIAQKSYDAIVSDYELPKKNGLQLLELLKKEKNGVPFILFTNRGREEIAIKALNLGAEGFVNKQGDLETVYTELAYCITQNVEKRRTEIALKNNEEQLRIILQNAPIGIVTVGRDYHFKTANDKFCKIIGYTEKELLDLSFKDVTYPEDLAESIEKMKELSAGRIESFTLEKRYVRKDGIIIVGRIIASAISDQQGNPYLFVAELQDITEDKKAKEAIVRERDKLNAIADNIGAGITIVDKEYHIVYANKFMKETSGDIEGKTCYKVLNNSSIVCPDCSVKEVFVKNLDRHSHEFFSSRHQVWSELIATPLKDANGKVIAAFEIAVNITEKKLREKELEENRQKFKTLFSENPAAICFKDTNHLVIEVNSKFTELFGYAPEEIIGKNIIESLILEEEKEKVLSEMHQNIQQPISFSGIRKRKDATKIYVTISIGPVLVNGKKIGYLEVYYDISDLISAQEKANKALDDALLARQQLELALNKTELLNDKLNVIGSFTRHDVRNKLVTINGNTYLAKKYAKENPLLLSNLQHIENASRNIVKILEFAKAYESLGTQELMPIDVGKAIDDATSLVAELKGAKIINECKNISVIADQMVMTIFHNLIDNSLKHGENITQIKIYPQNTPEGNLKIIYEDNGVGIPLDIKARLFEKGAGKGTGYGLYLIKRACDIYGWKAREIGVLGKGVKFEFTIPINN